MRAPDYPYPADEFDAAEARGGPRGVHRAPRSTRRRLLPFLAVLIIFPLLAYGVITWISDWDGLPGANTPPTVGEAVETPVTEDTEGTAEEPAVEETPTETVAPEPPAPEPDLTTPVEVFNATSRSGLAGGAAERVQEAGFTEVTAGNWDGADLAASVVYYATPDDVATAQLVAETLGIAQVQESAEEAATGVVVVLAADFEA